MLAAILVRSFSTVTLATLMSVVALQRREIVSQDRDENLAARLPDSKDLEQPKAPVLWRSMAAPTDEEIAASLPQPSTWPPAASPRSSLPRPRKATNSTSVRRRGKLGSRGASSNFTSIMTQRTISDDSVIVEANKNFNVIDGDVAVSIPPSQTIIPDSAWGSYWFQIDNNTRIIYRDPESVGPPTTFPETQLPSSPTLPTTSTTSSSTTATTSTAITANPSGGSSASTKRGNYSSNELSKGRYDKSTHVPGKQQQPDWVKDLLEHTGASSKELPAADRSVLITNVTLRDLRLSSAGQSVPSSSEGANTPVNFQKVVAITSEPFQAEVVFGTTSLRPALKDIKPPESVRKIFTDPPNRSPSTQSETKVNPTTTSGGSIEDTSAEDPEDASSLADKFSEIMSSNVPNGTLAPSVASSKNGSQETATPIAPLVQYPTNGFKSSDSKQLVDIDIAEDLLVSQRPTTGDSRIPTSATSTAVISSTSTTESSTSTSGSLTTTIYGRAPPTVPELQSLLKPYDFAPERAFIREEGVRFAESRAREVVQHQQQIQQQVQVQQQEQHQQQLQKQLQLQEQQQQQQQQQLPPQPPPPSLEQNPLEVVQQNTRGEEQPLNQEQRQQPQDRQQPLEQQVAEQLPSANTGRNVDTETLGRGQQLMPLDIRQDQWQRSQQGVVNPNRPQPLDFPQLPPTRPQQSAIPASSVQQEIPVSPISLPLPPRQSRLQPNQPQIPLDEQDRSPQQALISRQPLQQQRQSWLQASDQGQHGLVQIGEPLQLHQKLTELQFNPLSIQQESHPQPEIRQQQPHASIFEPAHIAPSERLERREPFWEPNIQTQFDKQPPAQPQQLLPQFAREQLATNRQLPQPPLGLLQPWTPIPSAGFAQDERPHDVQDFRRVPQGLPVLPIPLTILEPPSDTIPDPQRQWKQINEVPNSSIQLRKLSGADIPQPGPPSIWPVVRPVTDSIFEDLSSGEQGEAVSSGNCASTAVRKNSRPALGRRERKKTEAGDEMSSTTDELISNIEDANIHGPMGFPLPAVNSSSVNEQFLPSQQSAEVLISF